MAKGKSLERSFQEWAIKWIEAGVPPLLIANVLLPRALGIMVKARGAAPTTTLLREIADNIESNAPVLDAEGELIDRLGKLIGREPPSKSKH